MAFSAQTGFIPYTAGLVFLATLVWTLIYDTLYAMADRDEDLQDWSKVNRYSFCKIRSNYYHFVANLVNYYFYMNW